MKRTIVVFCTCLFLVFLSSCSKTASFDGSRTGNASQLIMEYSVFNTSHSQILELNENDMIDVKIVNEAGELSIKLQKEGSEKPIYDEDQVLTSEFQIAIEESGKYLLKVEGKHTKGSLSFVKK